MWLTQLILLKIPLQARYVIYSHRPFIQTPLSLLCTMWPLALGGGGSSKQIFGSWEPLGVRRKLDMSCFPTPFIRTCILAVKYAVMFKSIIETSINYQ
jgi:hypothetical protein